ncbi:MULTISPECIES: hypothetical protein [Erwinia]|uniref:hypothetical protein n=1 Tax=Erwinia TaxID=551 RepID=UPI0014385391|nr:MULTISPECIES: hypothetical protein [Erwinia]MBP2154410.1 hypothetical protein [Erwinia rhapontici]MCS3607066.1 hypothetical protein [Erwinia rhapontici]NKG30709.1 hypothetical protein [Erwinia rhapontici]NNS06567.1 hypothetical protein [Erwinia sp. JH02]UDQ81153.1 hypothetical protein LJN55_04650 [Erwinia rhapontici]
MASAGIHCLKGNIFWGKSDVLPAKTPAVLTALIIDDNFRGAGFTRFDDAELCFTLMNIDTSPARITAILLL